MLYPDDIPVNFSQRDAVDGVDPVFVQRWSPRSFKKVPIAERDLRIIMDAARWTPSAMNEQPWRIYTSTEESFTEFLDLLLPGNQQWACNASVLGFFVAKTQYDRNGKDNVCCEFDVGAAWMALTLQARRLGLYTHAMEGIEREQVCNYLKLEPKRYKVIAGFALGVMDTADKLPDDKREREAPSARKSLDEIWIQI